MSAGNASTHSRVRARVSMDIEILSLFPEYFESPFETSMIKRARHRGLLNIRLIQIRDFATDRHQRVDDRPFGGGPGMVLKPEPLFSAIESVKRPDSYVVYLSPQGKVLTAQKCQELSMHKHLVLICGHYEGIDERIIQKEVNEEVSIGDYVLTNGGPAAIVLVDSVARFLPGVLGHEQAAACDSFQKGVLDCPHYTRPVEFQGMEVPSVLLKGNHEEIAEWRKEQAWNKTKKIRPDLYVGALFSREKKPTNVLFENRVNIELLLTVQDLSRSVRFYHKCMGLPIVCANDEKMIFHLGNAQLILVRGKALAAHPMRLLLRDRDEFHEKIRKIQKALGDKLQIISGESEVEITFSDFDGYRWILAFSKGE